MVALHPAWQREKERFELTLKLIAVEARTRTIKQCTGLSDDRIRKIYGRYFKGASGVTARRRRGKSPRQVNHFVKNAERQSQATTLFYLFRATGLIGVLRSGEAVARWPHPDVEYGHRVCRAFETYRLLYDKPLYNFEWAWALLQAVSRSDELRLSRCRRCYILYIQDNYAVDIGCCPACEIVAERTRRPGAGCYGRG